MILFQLLDNKKIKSHDFKQKGYMNKLIVVIIPQSLIMIAIKEHKSNNYAFRKLLFTSLLIQMS